jgi:hypothetical protein
MRALLPVCGGSGFGHRIVMRRQPNAIESEKGQVPMRTTTRRRLAAGAAVFGAALCGATPAHAALTTPQANAYVVSADAIGSIVEVLPTPSSTFAPGGTSTLVGISAGPFASSSTLTATTSGDPTSGTSAASATVQSLTADLGASIATISLTGVNSQCMATPDGASGDGFISGGTVSILGLPAITLQANAAEDTGVTIPGVGQLTLNEQSVDSDGVRTINALHLVLLPTLGGANVIIGHVSCGGAPPTEPTPMISAPVAGGTTAAAAMGGVVYLRRRRRSIFDAS